MLDLSYTMIVQFVVKTKGNTFTKLKDIATKLAQTSHDTLHQ